MAKNINKYVTSLSNMLSVKEEDVKEWIMNNNYEKWQLKVIYRQVWNDDIEIPTLRKSIIDNTNYEISLY